MVDSISVNSNRKILTESKLNFDEIKGDVEIKEGDNVKSVGKNLEYIIDIDGDNSTKPILKKPEIKPITAKEFLDHIKNMPYFKDNNIINSLSVSLLSDEAMELINILINHMRSITKQFEASRELGIIIMSLVLAMADNIKDKLTEKASIMLGAAFAAGAISIAIHGIGAFKSFQGLGKPMNGNINSTIISANLITSTADPIAKIVEQVLQMFALNIDGDIKVGEARMNALGQIGSNNTDIQHNIENLIKMMIQVVEIILRADQETASAIAGNLRG